MYTFKSGFSDQHVKVRSTPQPGLLSEACGVSYTQFTLPKDVTVSTTFALEKGGNAARWWMELLTPTTARVLARYEHVSKGLADWKTFSSTSRLTKALPIPRARMKVSLPSAAFLSPRM